MNVKELNASRELFDMLVDFYDDSALQLPIKVGDSRHTAICDYRQALPARYLPPDEGGFMRDLLHLSRAEEIEKRWESQSVAEKWAKRLLEKYPSLRAEEPEYARELGVAPLAAKATYLGNGRVQIEGWDEPLLLTKTSHVNTLEYLVVHRKVSSDELVENTCTSNPSQTIRELCEALDGALDQYIKRPGKRYKGKGYSTTIIDGKKI